MVHRILILLFFLAVIAGCTSIKTVPPSESYTPFEFKPELSDVNIPVKISSDKIVNSINRQLAGMLYEDTNLYDDDIMMKVWKKDNISMEVVGEEFRYMVPLKVWLKTGFKIEKFGVVLSDYEETNFELTMKFITRISMDENWKIHTATVMSGYDWVTKPSLDIGIVKIPLTYIADKVIASQQDKLVSLIDEQAKTYLDIKQYVEDAWRQLQDPLPLSSDPPCWLTIAPSEIRMTPLAGRAGDIHSSIGMKAYSQIHLGTKPEVSVISLPKLKPSRNEAGSFSIYLVSDIFYDYAEKLAKTLMEGQEYSFKEGKKKIRIDNINLYGNSNRIIIQLNISGNVKGVIYLNGKPYYDGATQSIRIKEVDFDVDTKNKLLKSADWLAHGIFIKKIEPYLAFSIKSHLSESMDLVEKGLAGNQVSKNLTITGRLTQLTPIEIYLTEESLKAVILIKGVLEVNINNLDD